MALWRDESAAGDTEKLRKENEALRDRLAQLTTAATRISQCADADAALQELVDGA